jgi:hypothetical protein
MIMVNNNAVSVGILLPEQIVEKIDKEHCSDVPESRFLPRLVEHAYDALEGETGIMQIEPEVESSNKIIAIQIPDLYRDKCPVGCGNCAGVYINEVTRHHVACHCRACGVMLKDKRRR